MQAVFKSQPTSTNKAIISAYNELLKTKELVLNPVYQRDIVWTEEQMTNLIDTIMVMMPMPVFLLYMCIKDCNECIDGQNRLTTIRNFIEQEPSTGRLFPWIKYHEGGGKIEYIYYRNPATEVAMEAYCSEKNKGLKGKSKGKKLYRLMTLEEQRTFNSYELNLSIIKEQLTFEQRKAIFLRWQSGTGISQCDRFKNEEHPFCELVRNAKLEHGLSRKISSLLKSGRKNWLFDLYRLLNVFLNPTTPSPSMSTIKARTQIEGDTTDVISYSARFKQAITECEAFVDSIPYFNNLPLTHLVGYAHLFVNAPQHIKYHMVQEEFATKFYNSTIETINHCTLNNGPQEKLFNTEYQNIMVPAFQEAIKEVPAPSPTIKRKQVPQAIRNQAWDKYIGRQMAETKCLCCGITTITQRGFEAGHVIAASKGGADTVDNIRPICMPCNRSMGSQNMREYMTKHYPEMRLA